MARPCIFCAQDATTNEHLWGKRVIRDVFGRREAGATQAVVRHGQGGIFDGTFRDQVIRTYSTNVPNQKVKLCGACNNGWMSRLEQSCGEVVVRMARGETVLLDADAQSKLGLYALKTAVTHDAANRSRTRSVIPDQDVRLLAEEERLASRTTVNLFGYRGSRVSSYTGVPTTIRLDGPTAPAVPLFHATLLLRHLVLQVLGYDHQSKDGPLPYKDKAADDFYVRVAPPTTIGAVSYPPGDTLDDDLYDALALTGPFFSPTDRPSFTALP
jgi:hypothetical protein